MTHTATFPSDSFGSLLGLALAEEEPLALVLGRQAPDIHFPYPDVQSESFESGISETSAPVLVYTDGEYTWTESLRKISQVELTQLSTLPGRFLITDAVVVEVDADDSSDSTMDAPVSVQRNSAGYDTYLSREFGI
jgi:hypothetical protein